MSELYIKIIALALVSINGTLLLATTYCPTGRWVFSKKVLLENKLKTAVGVAGMLFPFIVWLWS